MGYLVTAPCPCSKEGEPRFKTIFPAEGDALAAPEGEHFLMPVERSTGWFVEARTCPGDEELDSNA
jgi:hypothetical protein